MRSYHFLAEVTFKIKKRSGNKRDKKQYCEAKKVLKRVVAAAMDQASREAIETVKINCDGRELFRILTHMVKKERDVLGVKRKRRKRTGC